MRLRASGRGVERVDESLSSNGNLVVRSGGASGFREKGGSGGEGRGGQGERS